jgi:hypothetical protein
MALYYELPIYKESYKLVLYLFTLTKNFNREYKYTLGQNMKDTGMQMVQYIFKANSSLDKMEALTLLSEQIEILKLELRLCVDMRLISPVQQAKAWESIDNISRQTAGWKKATENRL